MPALTIAAPSSNPIAVTLFGPMQVTVHGQPLPRLRSRKALALLALLALRQGRPVERQWLAVTLWPDTQEEQALGNLRTNLSELRHALGEQAARVQSPNRRSLCLEADGVDVDVTAFDAAIKRKTPAAFERAVALYTGPFLEGSQEEWVTQERSVREQDYLRALTTLADAALASGDWAAAIGHYRRALAVDPWDEAGRRGLMQALAGRGDANEAIRVYREFVDLLRDDPKATPDSQTTAIYTRLRAQAKQQTAQQPPVPAPPAVPAVSGRLAYSLTDLIGRDDERVEVRMRLRRARLVTLTGPGGIGKTRLSVAVATEAARDFADGVCLVALETLTDGSQIAGQVAGALGLTDEAGRDALATATEHLRSKCLLLVLDNCEQVLAACARVAAHLLAECGELRVLATSREPLGIAGEVVWSVPPLPVPDPGHLPASRSTRMRVIQSYEGVQLFMERAQSVHREFALTATNAAWVAQVCSQLDGIPLAIELAAARVRVLTVEQIAVRLTDHLSLLTGGSRVAQMRQQTLRATLDWSHDLLSAGERLLLGRLSVFAGGWDLEAAEGVCSGEGIESGAVLDLLTSLVDKSLVVFASPEASAQAVTARYRLLETVRQYAAERLTASGRIEQIKTAHQDYFTAFAGVAEPYLHGPDQGEWLSRLDAEADNFREVLSRYEMRAAREITVEIASTWLGLCAALARLWYSRGYYHEGRQRLERALDRTAGMAVSLPRVRALSAAGTLAWNQGDYVIAQVLTATCLSGARQIADQKLVADALNTLGLIAMHQGDYESAQAVLEESLDVRRQIGVPLGTAATLSSLSMVARERGDAPTARSYADECLTIRRQIGLPSGIAGELNNLGQIATSQGDFATARVLYEESLAVFRQVGVQRGIAYSLNNLGENATRQGDYRAAESFLEESLLILRQAGDQRGIAVVLTNLGDSVFHQGDLDAARASYRESLEICRQIGDQQHGMNDLEGLAAIIALEGNPEGAVRIWGAASALRETTGNPLSVLELPRQEEQIAQARTLMGEAAFTAAWNEGRARTWEEALADALQKP